MILLLPSQGQGLGLSLPGPLRVRCRIAREAGDVEEAAWPGLRAERALAGAGPEGRTGRGWLGDGGAGGVWLGRGLTRALQWRQATGRKELVSWKLCTKPMRPPSTELERRK